MNGNYIHGWGPIANFGAKGFVLQNPKVYHHVFPHSNVPSSGNGWFKHGLIIKASKVPQLGLSENGVPKNLIVAYFLDYNCYIFVHLPFVDRHDNPSTPEAASSMHVHPPKWGTIGVDPFPKSFMIIYFIRIIVAHSHPEFRIQTDRNSALRLRPLRLHLTSGPDKIWQRPSQNGGPHPKAEV